MNLISYDEQRLNVYNQIADAVDIEIKRLLPTPEFTGGSRQKAQTILRAIDRLRAAVIYKNGVHPNDSSQYKKISANLSLIDPNQINNLSLTTVDDMLDAYIREWEYEIEPYDYQGIDMPGRAGGFASQISLRRALDIARFNPFPGTDWGPLWGKTHTLKNVEEKLQVN